MASSYLEKKRERERESFMYVFESIVFLFKKSLENWYINVKGVLLSNTKEQASHV